MTRYFFDFFDGICWRRDGLGQEMGDIDDVVCEANESLVGLSAAFLPKSASGTVSFSVRDDLGNKVLLSTITLRTEVTGSRLAFPMEECLRLLTMF